MASSMIPVETTVFRSGNSQAVRIPKDLRLDGERVWIFKVGDSLRITPHRPSAMDVIEAITAGSPADWADGLTEPEELALEDIPAWE